MNKRRSTVVKLSGTAVRGMDSTIYVEYLKKFGNFIAELWETWDVVVTVGGGSLAREYILASKHLGGTDTRASLLGGDVCLLNCRLLIESLCSAGVIASPTPVESWDLAQDYLQTGRVPVLSGRWPCLTSDSVAAYFADLAQMDLVLKLTSDADAIYDNDPKLYPTAKPYHHLSYDDLMRMANSYDRRVAGSSYIVDVMAARLLKNSNIPLLVLHKDKLQTALEFIKIFCGLEPEPELYEGTLVGQLQTSQYTT